MIWRKCDLCSGTYCSNNYEDRKVRLVRWKGYVICANCRYKVLPVVKTLIADKVLKERKPKNYD